MQPIKLFKVIMSIPFQVFNIACAFHTRSNKLKFKCFNVAQTMVDSPPKFLLEKQLAFYGDLSNSPPKIITTQIYINDLIVMKR